ncbi:MAG: hypothetical protein PHV63_01870 [Candidatus Daviesbacteria bacterium]|nr:hypothetical protein [Candidatus Daviesbacteria bacterium]
MNKEFREDLIRYRGGYSDEIPEEILHSTSPNNNFKVRKSWFQGLVAHLENGIVFGEITEPDTIRKVERGLRRFTSERFRQKVRTTRRDIQYANLLIELVTGGN